MKEQVFQIEGREISHFVWWGRGMERGKVGRFSVACCWEGGRAEWAGGGLRKPRKLLNGGCAGEGVPKGIKKTSAKKG